MGGQLGYMAPFLGIGLISLVLFCALGIARGNAISSVKIRREIDSMRVNGKVTIADLARRYKTSERIVMMKLKEWNRRGFFVNGEFVPALPRTMRERSALDMAKMEFHFTGLRTKASRHD